MYILAVQNERQPRNTAQVKPDSLIAYIKDGATVSVMHSIASEAEVDNSVVNVSSRSSTIEHNTCDQLPDSINAIVGRENINNNNINSLVYKTMKTTKSLDKKRKSHSLTKNEITSLSKNTSIDSSLSLHIHSEVKPVNQLSFQLSNGYSSELQTNQLTTSQPNLLTLPQQHSFDTTIASSSVYEISARLLFMAIKWCKSMPSFAALPLSDQVKIFKITIKKYFSTFNYLIAI